MDERIRENIRQKIKNLENGYGRILARGETMPKSKLFSKEEIASLSEPVNPRDRIFAKRINFTSRGFEVEDPKLTEKRIESSERYNYAMKKGKREAEILEKAEKGYRADQEREKAEDRKFKKERIEKFEKPFKIFGKGLKAKKVKAKKTVKWSFGNIRL